MVLVIGAGACSFDHKSDLIFLTHIHMAPFFVKNSMFFATDFFSKSGKINNSSLIQQKNPDSWLKITG